MSFDPDLGDAAIKLVLAQFNRNGPADFLKSWKIPEIGKIFALLRLHGLHRTIFTVQKDALMIWLFLQGQTLPVLAQSGETLDEFRFADTFVRSKPCDFLVGQTYLSRPAAAGRTTLTFEKNRHAEIYLTFSPPPQPPPCSWQCCSQVENLAKTHSDKP